MLRKPFRFTVAHRSKMNCGNTTKQRNKPTTTVPLFYVVLNGHTLVHTYINVWSRWWSAKNYSEESSVCAHIRTHIRTLKCELLAFTGNGETVLILLVHHQLGILNTNNTRKLVNAACLTVKTVSRVQCTRS